MTPTEWLLSNDTGTSSKTICAVMTDARMYRDSDVPHDAGDFGRCYRLLKRFPLWRLSLHKVAEKHKAWGPMVEAWDELERLYERCCDERGEYVWRKDDDASKEFQARIRKLVDAGRLADGWTQAGHGSWSKGSGFIMTIDAEDAKRMAATLKKAK